MSGFFGIGIYNGKTVENLGTLWRTANIFGASFIFTIGRRYKAQCSDTLKTPKSVPLYEYETFAEMGIPNNCQLVGVEMTMDAVPLPQFQHPKRAIYLLGAEDHGLSPPILEKCVHVVQIPCPKPLSLNVASAGAVLLYDRFSKSCKGIEADV